MKQRLNFAPRPFKASDRALFLLWLLNGLALAGLLWLGYHWWTLRHRNGRVHEQLASLETRQSDLARRHQRALNEIGEVDPRQYRKQMTQFREIQLAVSAPWGKLLDDLSGLLPEDVRLTELEPVTVGGAEPDGPLMRLSAEARTKDAELNFIDALIGHPAFSAVRLDSEHYDTRGVALSFALQFTYRAEGG